MCVCGGGRDALKRLVMAGPMVYRHLHVHEMCNRYCIHLHVLMVSVGTVKSYQYMRARRRETY